MSNDRKNWLGLYDSYLSSLHYRYGSSWLGNSHTYSKDGSIYQSTGAASTYFIVNENIKKMSQNLDPKFLGLCWVNLKMSKMSSHALRSPRDCKDYHVSYAKHAELKGTVSRDFCSQFFPQTAPPGPIRDVLGPF